MNARRRASNGVPAGYIWAALAFILAFGIGVAAWFYLTGERVPPSDLEFAERPADRFAGLAAVLPVTLKGPLGIDTDGERLYIAESGASAIRVLGPAGQDIRTIPVESFGGAKASYPNDVDIFEDTISVVDQAGTGAAFTMNRVGDVQTQIGDDETAGTLNKPTAIAEGDSEIFVADAASGTIKVYGVDGTYKRSLGMQILPRITFVSGLFLEGDNLWVADSNAGRVLALDRETGDEREIIGSSMELPRGMARDDFGRLYVADELAGVVRVFDSSGKQVGRVGGPRTNGYESGGKLHTPHDLVWLQGRLYVTDTSTGSIRVYTVREP